MLMSQSKLIRYIFQIHIVVIAMLATSKNRGEAGTRDQLPHCLENM